LSPEKTVRDILADGGDWVTVRGGKTHVQGYLKEFLFEPNLADARVSTLSGGERSRLLLAREFAREANLLVLDEPTNDLDLETLDLLQEVIADYEGTVLIVSHDRDFLDRTVTVTLGLDSSGKVDIVAGGYADWAAKRVAAGGSVKASGSRSAANAAAAASNAGPRPEPARESPSLGRKLTYKDQRDFDLLPARVDELTAAIVRNEAELADPALYTINPVRFASIAAAIDTAKAERSAAESRWLALAEQVEAFGG
jgi:ATP-binding cassette subfamily F protein uup